MNEVQWDLAIHETGHALIFDSLKLPFIDVAANPAEGYGVVRHVNLNDFSVHQYLTVIVAGQMAMDIDGRSQLLSNRRLSERIPVMFARADFRDPDGDVYKALCLAHASPDHSLDIGFPPPPDNIEQSNGRTIFNTTPALNAALPRITEAEVDAERCLRDRWPEVLGVARTLCRRKSHRLQFEEFNYRLLDVRKKLRKRLYKWSTGRRA